jgi:hypothetical protein
MFSVVGRSFLAVLNKTIYGFTLVAEDSVDTIYGEKLMVRRLLNYNPRNLQEFGWLPIWNIRFTVFKSRHNKIGRKF